MGHLFERFSREEAGTTTIDWIVLTAGMVLMALSLVLTITGEADVVTEDGVEFTREAPTSHPS